jgi:hypothetical protein
MTAKRFPVPDSAAIRQLEGVWLIGAKPDKGGCLDHWYSQTEIEFEFRKTGGRALMYEADGLFTPIKIAGIQTSGDILTIQAEARDGELHSVMRLRPVSPDELQMLSLEGAPEHATQFAYKCGEADVSVTRGVSLDRLALIEPPITGGEGLLGVVPGVADADLCKGHVLTGAAALKHRFLQFELYGPVHYWVLGLGFSPQHKFEFDFVRSVEDRGEKGLISICKPARKGADGTLLQRGGGLTISRSFRMANGSIFPNSPQRSCGANRVIRLVGGCTGGERYGPRHSSGGNLRIKRTAVAENLIEALGFRGRAATDP